VEAREGLFFSFGYRNITLQERSPAGEWIWGRGCWFYVDLYTPTIDVNDPHMRSFLSFFLFFLLSAGAMAQRHYVYVQAEDRQPFYVRSGTVIHSSSPSGYVIIPRLSDSTYHFIIGFPKAGDPMAEFTVALAHRDHGYLLRRSSGAFSLTDLQGGEVLQGQVSEPKRGEPHADAMPGTGDAFTNSLALAISDPQLALTELVKKEDMEPEVKKEATKPAAAAPAPLAVAAKPTDNAKGQPAKVAPMDSLKTASKDDPPRKMAEPERKTAAPVTVAAPVVLKPRKISELQGQNGWEGIYVDGASHGREDTVKVWISHEEPAAAAISLNDTVTAAIAADFSPKKDPASLPGELQPGSPLDAEKKALGTQKPGEGMDKIPVKEDPAGQARSDCKAMATQKEVDALRKKMVSLGDEDAQVALALKSFKLKCHTTAQVKDICFVFVRNEGKYKLMDAAYPQVYDPGRFGELEPLLTDPYFIHRFHTLIKPAQAP
jgi:hypothetical protein